MGKTMGQGRMPSLLCPQLTQRDIERCGCRLSRIVSSRYETKLISQHSGVLFSKPNQVSFLLTPPEALSLRVSVFQIEQIEWRPARSLLPLHPLGGALRVS